MQKWIILIIISVIVVLGIFIVLNVNVETEYVPEAEIEDAELRKTVVTLYFKNKNTEELARESRLIDSKDLLKNPYEALLKLLLDGPENSSYEKVFPEGVEVLNATLNNNCVEINVNKALEEAKLDESQIEELLDSIYSTLSELTEVSSIKVLIEGNEVDGISKSISKLEVENNDENKI